MNVLIAIFMWKSLFGSVKSYFQNFEERQSQMITLYWSRKVVQSWISMKFYKS